MTIVPKIRWAPGPAPQSVLVSARVPQPTAALDPEVCIRFTNVRKTYRLYGSFQDMALDRLGAPSFMLRKRGEDICDFNALDGINLEVRRGERVGIIGRNGAGKTTLLKLITGNFAPSAGEVEVRGRIQAMMVTGLGFHPEFTGRENARSALIYNGLAGRDLEDALNDVMGFVELGDFFDRPVNTYSLGMSARLQFAVATAVKPEILIIDEVLGAGDAYFAAKCADRMRKLTKSDCSLLVVSHSLDQILSFCQRAIWMDAGGIRMAGGAAEVVRAYEAYMENLRQQSVLEAPTEKSEAVTKWHEEIFEKMLHPSGNVRWIGEKGLKIKDAFVVDERGERQTTLLSGQRYKIKVAIESEMTERLPFKVSVLFITETGQDVCRCLGPDLERSVTAGEAFEMELDLGELLLANGNYVFSVALFREFDPEHPEKSRRYDLLPRHHPFRVLGRLYAEPGIFHHPYHWKQV